MGPAILLRDVQHPHQVSQYHRDRVEMQRRANHNPADSLCRVLPDQQTCEAHGRIHIREISSPPAKYFERYRERDGEDQHRRVSY